eukprot:scaffold2929_cov107-Cylindrotheca_fusiformis.AAC.8
MIIPFSPSFFASYVLLSFFLLLCPHEAQGWGTIGHEIVGNLAWHRLTNSTQSWVEKLLEHRKKTNDTSLSPLAEVADWADQVRHWMGWSAPLHFIDVRDDLIEGGCQAVVPTKDCDFQYERDCPDDVCVAGAILNYTNQLMMEQPPSKSKTVRNLLRGSGKELSKGYNRTQALMFLTQ